MSAVRPEDTAGLGERVAQAIPGDDPGRSLRRDSLRLSRTVALSVGIQGPTAGVIVGPAVLAGIVGPSGALAYLLGFLAMAFCAYAFVLFSRSFNTASSVYAFNGAAWGPRYGFVSAWLFLFVYVSFAAAVYASTADIAGALLASLGVHIDWVVLATAGWALTMALAVASIRLSALVIFVLEGAAILLVLAVTVIIVASGDHHGHALSSTPFGLHGIAFGVLGLGVVNAFGAFSGFEGAAVLGEESSHGTRTIPLAIAGSLIVSALFYIVVTWVVDNSYASPHQLAADPAPLAHLADHYVGTVMGRLVNLAAVVSAVGAQLACVNAAARLLFALGRELGGDGRVGDRLTRTSRRRGSPIGALAVVGTVSLVGVLAFSFEAQALQALVIIVTYGSYLILIAYLLTILAAMRWIWLHGRRPVPLGALTVGALVLGYVLYDTFHPFPAAPFDADVWAAAGTLLLGSALTLVPAVRRRLGASPLLRAVRGVPAEPVTV